MIRLPVSLALASVLVASTPLAATSAQRPAGKASGQGTPWVAPVPRPLGPGSIVARQKISSTRGGLEDTLDRTDNFGTAVTGMGDLDGDGVDDLAVGAGADAPGAVWLLFRHADGTVKSFEKLQGAVLGDLGSAVASLGDLDSNGIQDLAMSMDDGFNGPGRVRVARLGPGGEILATRIISFGGLLDPQDHFGAGLARIGDLDGDGIDELAVGAWGDDDGAAGSGAVWVVFLDEEGAVRARQKISNLEGGLGNVLAVGSQFGRGLAALGDFDGDGTPDLAVGAPHVQRVFVLFLEPDGTVASHRAISATEGGFTGVLSPQDSFGVALAGLGDLDGDGARDLAVGAHGDDDAGDDAGAVWVLFLNTDGTVRDHRKIAGSPFGFLASAESFGFALAALGDPLVDPFLELVVGAPGHEAPDDDDDADFDSGGIHELRLGHDGLVASRQLVDAASSGFLSTLDPVDHFGWSVAELGDLDGDGIGELAVGAPGDDDGFNIENGAVWILFQRSDGTVRSYQKISATHGGFPFGLSPFGEFGHAVAGLGDLDGDGVGELAVSQPAGARVFVLFLDADGSVKHGHRIATNQGGFVGSPGSQFGFSLARLGDLDGDGVDELVAGVAGVLSGVWVLFLDADGRVKAQQKIDADVGGFTGEPEVGDRFGSSVTRIGDLDHDGVEDLAVGAPFDDDGALDAGAVWVLFLRPDGTVKGHHEIRSGEGGLALGTGHWFGKSVAFLGDLDCNGTGDLAVAAPGEVNQFGIQVGGAWILFLESDGSVGHSLKLAGVAGTNQTVGSLAGPGDLDGDGVFDLALGVPLDDDGGKPGIGAGLGENAGALWILFLDGLAVADFEAGDDQARTPLVNGRSLSSPPGFGRTLALASTGANAGPAIFDSTPLGPNDPSQDRDLLVGQGNLLIFQNSLVPMQTVPGIFDRPNDDQDGGTVAFSFTHGPVEPAHLDLVDIDLGSGQTAIVTLFDAATRTRVYWVPAGWTEDLIAHGPPGVRTLDLHALAPQPGFASVATATESPGFDPRAVVRIEVRLGSSGAVDDLCWDPHPDE